MRKLTGFFKPLEDAGPDYWIPVAGLFILAAGLAYLIACKFRAKGQEPDISAYKLAPVELKLDLPPWQFVGECGVCGLEHGSNAAWDGNKQACVDALLAKMPKRGEHGRFAKRSREHENG